MMRSAKWDYGVTWREDYDMDYEPTPSWIVPIDDFSKDWENHPNLHKGNQNQHQNAKMI